MSNSCILCQKTNEETLYQDLFLRIILVADNYYPGYLRVVTNQHISEFSDLTEINSTHLMQAVYQAEKIIRQTIKPDKINIASLGNQVPHLHWHIIPRFFNDLNFPNSIWGEIKNHGWTPNHNSLNQLVELKQQFKNFSY